MQVCFNPQSICEPTLSGYDLPVEVKRLPIAAANTWKTRHSLRTRLKS
ncbi:MAG: hypothetical protein HC769_23355 [Cyanobacteria bacterium CRU_2_1]|nr:hypothetical protein [Cyanobacteria bacterium RU_5_0]NJR61508.1 hypothetical protein [Cyanobacteria bacterium CRU_2_1]